MACRLPATSGMAYSAAQPAARAASLLQRQRGAAAGPIAAAAPHWEQSMHSWLSSRSRRPARSRRRLTRARAARNDATPPTMPMLDRTAKTLTLQIGESEVRERKNERPNASPWVPTAEALRTPITQQWAHSIGFPKVSAARWNDDAMSDGPILAHHSCDAAVAISVARRRRSPEPGENDVRHPPFPHVSRLTLPIPRPSLHPSHIVVRRRRCVVVPCRWSWRRVASGFKRTAR